ncbi:hypothetical protein GALMADRAFT_271603 [Galerina marginata CBS 339.88]|uniref:Uncharacterized protein n=1 Tax=Galerina marginata (strain CBS 339.88) TaxID=685588 RepID=A0A067SGT8_GALM3|nr:hypothetical protein GALMADRAFT_271603 [Galerina marginata CBS 339.88]
MMEFSYRRPSGSSSTSTSTASPSTSRSISASSSSFSSTAGLHMDQDSPFSATRPIFNFNSDLDSEDDPAPAPDHVKWQGSQTACQALNQLIRSSVNEPSGVGARGWQREPSFDQIPGFSSLSTTDASKASTSSSAFTPTSASANKQPHASTRPHLRARISETKSRPTSLSSSSPNVASPLPFFDKTNPSQFLDILKGVSARVDENAGVRPRKSAGNIAGPTRPIKTNGKKRSRGVSLGGSPDMSGVAAAVGRAKKGRVDTLRGMEAKPDIKDKGKGRASPLPPPDADGRGPTGQAYESGVPSSSTSTLASNETLTMDVDDDLSVTYHRLSPKTPSQARMPPPPVPRTKPPDASSSRQSHHQLPTRHVESKPAPAPKFHPLLVEPPPKSNPSTHKPQPTTAAHPIPKPEPKPLRQPVQAPAPTPPFANSQSSRPPVLGMRRTHTFPTSGMSTSLHKSGALPTKQKSFKPPLLSASQPQSQARSQGSGSVTAKPQPQAKPQAVPQQQYQQPARRSHAPGSNNSSASTSPVSARGPASSNYLNTSSSVPPSSSLSASTSSTRSSISGRGGSVATSAPRVPAVKPVTAAPVLVAAQPSVPAPAPKASPPLPEPTDGDPDSSFGDMSFDIDADALEETMRMFD